MDQARRLQVIQEADPVPGCPQPWPRMMTGPPSGVGASQYATAEWSSRPSAVARNSTGYTGPLPTAAAATGFAAVIGGPTAGEVGQEPSRRRLGSRSGRRSAAGMVPCGNVVTGTAWTVVLGRTGCSSADPSEGPAADRRPPARRVWPGRPRPAPIPANAPAAPSRQQQDNPIAAPSRHLDQPSPAPPGPCRWPPGRCPVGAGHEHDAGHRDSVSGVSRHPSERQRPNGA